MALKLEKVGAHVSSISISVNQNVLLVPLFCEPEVDSYFSAFKRTAAALNWTKEFHEKL